MTTTQASHLLQQQLALLTAKKNMFYQSRDEIDTLVLGSSHGDFGFDPGFFPSSFNACCRSQDLKHSYFLYEKLVKESAIKNVVIFYSVFSPGFFLEKSKSEKEISIAMKKSFDLDLDYEDDFLKDIDGNIKNSFFDSRLLIKGRSGFFPSEGKSFISNDYPALLRVVDHLKFNILSDSIWYLERIVNLSKKMNNNLYFLLPPVRSDYKKIAGESKYLFRHLYKLLEIVELNGLINLYDDNGFKDDFFGDFDHLNPLGKGVERLSLLVKSEIEKSL